MIKLSCIMPKSQVVDALLLWVLRRVKSRTDLLIWVQPFVALASVVIATKKMVAMQYRSLNIVTMTFLGVPIIKEPKTLFKSNPLGPYSRIFTQP